MANTPVQEEYSRLAPNYDQRWSFYVETSLQETINRLNIKPQERILDLGCGTGTLIEKLLQFVPEKNLVGLDASQEMLSVAKQKLPTSVDLHLGNADNLPFPSESFERIISTSSFHYFPNPSQAIREAKRVLKPNGCLVITDWCYDYLSCRILDVFLRLFNRAHFRTYKAKELQQLLQEEGFSDVSIERYKLNWFWGMMTAKAIKK